MKKIDNHDESIIDREDEIADLGAASVETKGADPNVNEFDGLIATGVLAE